MTKQERQTYTVRCERSEGWWAISVVDLPGAFGRARRLSQAKETACDVIAMMLGVPSDSFDVELEPVISPVVNRSLKRALTARRLADEVQSTALEATRNAARALVDSGVTVRDAGEILGISFQRVSQLVLEAPDRAAS